MPRRETVTRVLDGATFETASRKHPVRLANVKVPGAGQPGSEVARQRLALLVEGKEVLIQTLAVDRNQRSDCSVARVTVDGKSVNAAMRTGT